MPGEMESVLHLANKAIIRKKLNHQDTKAQSKAPRVGERYGIGLAMRVIISITLILSWLGQELVGLQVRGGQHYFYVSINGNDTWSGRLPANNAAGTDGPFATLTRARDAIRQLKASGQFDAPVIVMVLQGSYYLREPFVLESQDAGTTEKPITYTAYPGEKPVLSGGRRITGWKPYKDSIMQCPLPEASRGKWKFRQLFFNGQSHIRARWPNRDPKDALYGGWAFIESIPSSSDESPTLFRYEPGDSPRHWAKPSQAEVNIFPWLCWVNDIIPVKEANAGTRTITLGRQVHHPWMPLMNGNRFLVENVLEELDQPGEWCLDGETGVLYFWPPQGSVEAGEVVAPVTDRLVELRGTPSDPVKHIHISGLTFTQTLSPFPEQQHPESHHSPTLRGEAVRLENAEDCRIEDNLFYAVGGDGVRLQGYNARNQILDNEIAYSGGAGISLASNSPQNTESWKDKAELARYSRLYPKSIRNIISNNHIHHGGIIKKNCGGIQLFGINSVDNVISHNLIHDMSDKGMTMQDGYGRFIVEFNEMYRLGLEISDTGGIMTNRWFVLEEDEDLRQGNILRYNLVRDVIGCGAYGEPREGKQALSKTAGGRIWTPYYTWGIYSDNSGVDITVFGNIIVRNVLGGTSIPVGDPKNNRIENNIMIDGSAHQADLRIGGDAATGNRFVRNVIYYTSPQAALLNVNSRTRQSFTECDYNLYFPAGGQPLVIQGIPGGSLRQWHEMGYDTHSVVADPLFVDPVKGDYRLRPESPAFQLGFRPIDVQHIGLQGKRRPTDAK
jgi:hypothetical protein